MRRIIAVAVLLRSGPVRADAPSRCPSGVIASVSKSFPKATISACKAEREHGNNLFEVKLTRSGGARLEVDFAADGTILQVEEPIAIDALPGPVRKAFAAKYPAAKATAADKQTAGKAVRYEITFVIDKARKEATFAMDGAFLEEE